MKTYVDLKNVSIVTGVNGEKKFLSELNWTLKEKEIWLIMGPNGGGKTPFIQALTGIYDFKPEANGYAQNLWEKQFSVVSFESAAKLIEDELKNDNSDFVEGGVDIGQTPFTFMAKELGATAPFHSYEAFLSNKWVQLCGIERFATTGLKFLSTGEVRRTLICLSLLKENKAIVLFDPFSGLDAQSRQDLLSVFESLNKDYLLGNITVCPIYCFNREDEIPVGVNRVLEFRNGRANSYFSKEEWDRREKTVDEIDLKKTEEAFEIAKSFSVGLFHGERVQLGDELVRMKGVRVSWDGRQILDGVDWTVRFGEHWLVRGPNGCGKTTLLELITGDNMQVFCNDVSLFGQRRGSGESVWDIKRRLGIVSYRLHLEYRRVKSMTIEGVLLSGFFDSIGLYESVTMDQRRAAAFWLQLGGFEGRGSELFDDLSFGEQRAILVLRAMIKAPPLLILDEPCHALDEENRNRVLWLLQRIAETGLSTLIHVTHEPSEVLPCETRLLEFVDGKVVTGFNKN